MMQVIASKMLQDLLSIPRKIASLSYFAYSIEHKVGLAWSSLTVDKRLVSAGPEFVIIAKSAVRRPGNIVWPMSEEIELEGVQCSAVMPYCWSSCELLTSLKDCCCEPISLIVLLSLSLIERPESLVCWAVDTGAETPDSLLDLDTFLYRNRFGKMLQGVTYSGGASI